MLIEGSAEFRGLSEAKASARFKSVGANKKFRAVPQSSAQNIIIPKGDNEKSSVRLRQNKIVQRKPCAVIEKV